MTQKDYIKLAAVMAATRPRPGNPYDPEDGERYCERRDKWDDVVDGLCSMLKCDNVRFDEDRFRKACLA